jgi:hypothetical protein
MSPPGVDVLLLWTGVLCCCRHTKHRQERVMKELSAAVPAPVDIEELVKIGRHAEVMTCMRLTSGYASNTLLYK